jgi:hypothetical protein
VWEGAILLGAFVADGPSSQPRDTVLGGIVGAAMGAGIDALIHRHEVRFEATTSAPALDRPALRFSVRF